MGATATATRMTANPQIPAAEVGEAFARFREQK
jgi:hypothetical protein